MKILHLKISRDFHTNHPLAIWSCISPLWTHNGLSTFTRVRTLLRKMYACCLDKTGRIAVSIRSVRNVQFARAVSFKCHILCVCVCVCLWIHIYVWMWTYISRTERMCVCVFVCAIPRVRLDIFHHTSPRYVRAYYVAAEHSINPIIFI